MIPRTTVLLTNGAFLRRRCFQLKDYIERNQAMDEQPMRNQGHAGGTTGGGVTTIDQGRMMEKAKTAGNQAMDQAKTTANQAMDQAKTTANQVKTTANQVMEQTKATANQAMDQAKTMARN